MRKDTTFLYEKAPAKKWEESFLLGNGSLGASIFGNTEKEKIILNHDTLWSGYPRKNEVRGEGKASLDRAKALLREKKYVEADAEIASNFSSYASDCYLAMADLELEFLNFEGKVTGYKRTLDLSKGIFEASYNRGQAKYYVRSYVSYPDNMLVWRINCEGGRFSLKVGLTSQLYSKTYSDGNGLYLEGECPVTSQQNIDRTDRKTLYYDDPQKRGIRFMTALKVISNGERVSYDEGLTTNGNYIEIKNTSYLEIRLVARTSYNGSDKHPFLEGRPYISECKDALAKCLEKQENELLSRHIKDHKRYFSRVSLEIDSPIMSRVPTSERLRRFANDDSDKALYVLLFNL